MTKLGRTIADGAVGVVLCAVSLWVVTACTGQQIKASADGTAAVSHTVAQLAVNPITGLVDVTAGSLDNAINAYLTEHPEKLQTTWGLGEWAAVLLPGVFGGATRRKATELVTTLLKVATSTPDESKPA